MFPSGTEVNFSCRFTGKEKAAAVERAISFFFVLLWINAMNRKTDKLFETNPARLNSQQLSLSGGKKKKKRDFKLIAICLILLTNSFNVILKSQLPNKVSRRGCFRLDEIPVPVLTTDIEFYTIAHHKAVNGALHHRPSEGSAPNCFWCWGSYILDPRGNFEIVSKWCCSTWCIRVYSL